MLTDEQILIKMREAFVGFSRPEHFANYTHCEECAEHDELLRSRDLDSLSIEDVGHIGWDPICYTDTTGFAYYLPALARLALEPPANPPGWYGFQLFFHLTRANGGARCLDAFTVQQRQAVADLLSHIAQSRHEVVVQNCQTDALSHAMELWSKPPLPTTP